MPADEGLARLAPVVVAALAAAAAFHAIDALPVGVFYDDALYTILGKSLATGHGYRYLNIPLTPNATHYPPGYPLLLALLWRLAPHFPENAVLFKSVNAGLVGVVAVLAYRFGRVRFAWNAWLAAFIALAGTAAIPLLVLSSAVMSEVLFLALLLPWLMVAERSLAIRSPSRAALLGGLAALLFYVRAHAIVLFPVLAIAYAIERRRREAFAAIVAGALVVTPWFVWVALNDRGIPNSLRGSYGSYGAWMLDGIRAEGSQVIIATLRDNLATCAAVVERSFALFQRQPFQLIALVAVLVLFAAGCAAFFTRARVTLLFIVAYLGVAMVWPFSPLRFLWGVWPLIILFLGAGASFLLARRSGPRAAPRRAVGAAAAAIALLGMLLFNVRGYANAWWTTVSRPVTPRIQAQLQWMAAHRRGTTVAADDEGAVYLYTGAQAVPTNVFTVGQYFRRRSVAEDVANLRTIIETFRPAFVLAWSYPTIAAAESLSVHSRQPREALLRIDTLAGGGRVYEQAGDMSGARRR